jgi:two-component system, LytTR family, response regulator
MSTQQPIMMLATSKGVEFIQPHTIIRIEAISNYSKLYFNNGKTLVVAKVLRWFEEALKTSGFLRTHRTHLVNYQFIHRYTRCGKLTLLSGETIKVARGKKKTLFYQEQVVIRA